MPRACAKLGVPLSAVVTLLVSSMMVGGPIVSMPRPGGYLDYLREANRLLELDPLDWLILLAGSTLSGTVVLLILRYKPVSQ
jgi:hypothetical protein